MDRVEPESIDLGALSTRPIVLCGFMGVGKSTIGRRLSRRLGRPFFDLDAQIVARLGASVPELFNTGRELEFRETEASILRELALRDPPSVIALGGGAYDDPSSRELLRVHAFVVHLDQNWQALYPALARLRESRPLLSSRSNAEIEALYYQRRANYLLADLTVAIPRAGVARATREVVHALLTYSRTITN
ncbi:MAG TPA: shikimate kinase [Acidimicrobiales bacterium]|nr:shikimate kinase [Acidimicrobiales bacterium]